MKRLSFCIVIAAILLLLSACSSSSSNSDTAPKPNKNSSFTAIAPDSEGTIVIDADSIASDAAYYNYDADGITVQLVSVRDEEGKIHIAFNTCQSCSPSPKAYYTRSGNKLRCENCGYEFAPEDVGVVHGGCNPWPIDGVAITDTEINIPAQTLDSMRDTFAKWAGPTQ